MAAWASGLQTLLGFEEDIFKMTPRAIDINDTRALHVARLVRDRPAQHGEDRCGLQNRDLRGLLQGRRRNTRYSGSELLVRKLTEMVPIFRFTILCQTLVGNLRSRTPILRPAIPGRDFFPKPGKSCWIHRLQGYGRKLSGRRTLSFSPYAMSITATWFRKI